MTNKISHQAIVDGMIKKLNRLNAKPRTIESYKKKAQKIINSDYQVVVRLKELKKLISVENPSMTYSTKAKKVKVPTNNLFEAKQDKLKKVLNEIGKFKAQNVQIKQLQAEWGSSKILEIKVNQTQTKKQIEALGNKMSKLFERDGMSGRMSISLRYDKGWRSGYFTNFGEPIELYDPDMYDDEHHHYVDHQDSFKRFVIYMSDKPLPRVGDSDNNDCLYDCLKFVLHDNLPWSCPNALKHYLKVDRWAKVDLALIPKIEKKLVNVGINVTGDYVYTSPIKSLKQVNIKVINEHCTIDLQENTKIEGVNISYQQRKPIIMHPTTFMAYDGEKEYLMSQQEMYNHKLFKTDYILVSKRDNDLTLQEEHKEFVRDAIKLKRETKGLINLFKTGSSKICALNLFDRFTKHIKNADHIKQAEAKTINLASRGAIIFTDDYEGPAYKFDVKSMYPSILNSRLLFPIKEGEFHKLSHDEFQEMKSSFFKYGIYKVVIPYKESCRKLFRFNKFNEYTHIDLTRAKELGLEMSIVDDDQANFLYYSRDKCLTGTELFGNYVDLLFDLKQKKIGHAKEILNVLWGALSQVNLKSIDINANAQHVYKVNDNSYVYKINPSNFDENVTLIKEINNDKQYKTGFARIMPFLISKGRSNISKIMQPYINSVFRCHTDGFMCNEYPTNIQLGDGLGDLVYEGYNPNYYKIKNSYNKNDFNINKPVSS